MNCIRKAAVYPSALGINENYQQALLAGTVCRVFNLLLMNEMGMDTTSLFARSLSLTEFEQSNTKHNKVRDLRKL
jgi:hypothetical protein